MPQGKYFVDGFSLTANRDCYLVEVQEEPEFHDFINVPLPPDWIFESKYAIWLMDENKSITDRARDGEKVRKLLQRNRSLAGVGQ